MMYIQMSGALVTIRVSRDMKERMSKAGVNWSEELRRVIEEKLAEDRRGKADAELDRLLSSVRPGFDAAHAIKEGRRRG